MKIFLKLKHWQLFGIIWGVPFLLNIFTFSNPILTIIVFPAVVIVFAFGSLGWIWSIAVCLNPRLPEGVILNIKRFKILFSIPIIYIIIVLAWLGITFGGGIVDLEYANPTVIAWVVIPMQFVSLILILWGIMFASKTLKSIEIGRLAKFNDYMGEIFLIWFSMIGCWVLQPRLNSLIKL